MKDGKYRVMLIKIEKLEKREKLNEGEKLQLEVMRGEVAKHEKKHFPL